MRVACSLVMQWLTSKKKVSQERMTPHGRQPGSAWWEDNGRWCGEWGVGRGEVESVGRGLGDRGRYQGGALLPLLLQVVFVHKFPASRKSLEGPKR